MATAKTDFATLLREETRSASVKLASILIPRGWRSYYVGHNSQVAIERPDGSAVTIDFVRRQFSAGIGFILPCLNTKDYAPDYKRTALISEAIEWLNSV
jgi:hypothetical protein